MKWQFKEHLIEPVIFLLWHQNYIGLSKIGSTDNLQGKLCASKSNWFPAAATHTSNTYVKKWALEKKEM